MASLGMSTATATQSYIARHPLVGFFTLAYGLAWLAWLPLELAGNGWGVFHLRLPFFVFAVLATFGGPSVAAFTVTGISEGRDGMRRLLRRYVQGRVGWLWYGLILLGIPLAFLIGSSVELGAAPWLTLAHKVPLFINAYPLLLIIALPTGPLGEEPGWRGFALPRLQAALGPLRGTLLLGVLWALWHTPLFFLPEWEGRAPLGIFVLAFCAWVIPFAIIMTWIYNHTRGSLLIAILTHAALNATVGLIALQALHVPNDIFLQAKLWWPIAIALILATRGQLGYGADDEMNGGSVQ